MSIFSDCNDILKTSPLSETVVYKGTGALTEEINGIFRRQYLRLDTETGQDVQTDELNLWIVLSDLTQEPSEGEYFEIDSTTYRVDEMQKDAHGAAYIFLSET